LLVVIDQGSQDRDEELPRLQNKALHQNLWVDRGRNEEFTVGFFEAWQDKRMMGRDEEDLGRDGTKSCGIVLPTWLDYPSSSCFPAELDSVSPSNDKYTKSGLETKKYTAA